MKQYLEATFFIDFQHENIQDFVTATVGSLTDKREIAKSLFYGVRDGFLYNPYNLYLEKDKYKSSEIVQRDKGHCIDKALVLVASLRSVGIPSRLSFSKVINHIGTERLEEILGTNVLAFHGNAELFLNEKWIKVTPAFNKTLCDKLNVEPLDFNGSDDCLFQQYDSEGGKFMEYLHEYGHFSDLPFDLFMSELKGHYPHIFTSGARTLITAPES